jgi:diguanylate cyclase (GGDEF)-like protein
MLVKNLFGLLSKTSRMTDVIGRQGDAEAGVLLPHTGKLGAAIKAEKFRRLVERSELIPGVAARVSVGVSEYPSLCMDAETLWSTADSAHFQVKRVGNKVCLAATPKGLEPDFVSRV